MNTLTNLGTKFAAAVIATGLVATAAFAGSGAVLTITLPEPVTLNGSTLASGQYKVTESNMADGNNLIVFRSDKGQSTAVVAMRSAEAAPDQKSEVILSNENGRMRLDKLFVAGESAGYQFAESK